MKMKNVTEAKPVENPPGIIRKTLAYNDEAMLCHFNLKKGGKIPLHDHRATQIGYIIKGKVKFLAENPEDETFAQAGDSYVFSAYVKHGTEVIEDSEYVEVFVGGDDVPKNKPAPDIFLKVVSELGVVPENCLVFENSDIGMHSGVAAGMKCIVIPSPYTKGQDFTGAHKVLSSLADVDLNTFPCDL